MEGNMVWDEGVSENNPSVPRYYTLFSFLKLNSHCHLFFLETLLILFVPLILPIAYYRPLFSPKVQNNTRLIQ